MSDLYNVLGITKDASQTDVRKAFRRLMSAHHPDRAGGDSEMFRAVKEAYEVLYDEPKRKIYDDTGTFRTVAEDTLVAQAYRHLAALFHQIIEESLAANLDLASNDLVKAVEDSLDENVRLSKDAMRANQETRRKLGIVKDRLHRSEFTKANAKMQQAVLEGVLEGKIKNAQSEKIAITQALELLARMRELSKGYYYVTDEAPRITAFHDPFTYSGAYSSSRTY